MLVTLEDLYTGFTGRKVVRTDSEEFRDSGMLVEKQCGDFADVREVRKEFADIVSPTTSRQDGVLRRWLPVRPYELDDGWRWYRRLKLAWGVFTGRYDAFDWTLTDAIKNEKH